VLEGSKRWTITSEQREERLISVTHTRIILLLSAADAARCTLWFSKLLVHALTLSRASGSVQSASLLQGQAYSRKAHCCLPKIQKRLCERARHGTARRREPADAGAGHSISE